MIRKEYLMAVAYKKVSDEENRDQNNDDEEDIYETTYKV